MNENGFRELLSHLYAGVHQPARLTDFMRQLALVSGSHTIGLTRRNHIRRTGAAVQMYGLGAGVDIATYEREFVSADDNLWFERAFPTIRTGTIVNGDEWATKGEVKQTRYHADFLSTIDTMHSVAICGYLHGPHTALLSLCRSERQGTFDNDDMRLIRELTPHWVNAYALLKQHEEFASFTQGLLPALFSLDSQLRWTAGNAAAERMIGFGWLRGRIGTRIEPASSLSRKSWEAALRDLRECASISGWAGKAIPIHDTTGTLVAFASLRPFGLAGPREGLPDYVLFVRPLRFACAGDLSASLRSLFALTEAEAVLATALRDQRDIVQTARAVSIAETTARTRLQSIFDKTGTHRQADVIRLLDVLAETLS